MPYYNEFIYIVLPHGIYYKVLNFTLLLLVLHSSKILYSCVYMSGSHASITQYSNIYCSCVFQSIPAYENMIKGGRYDVFVLACIYSFIIYTYHFIRL